MYLIYGMGEVGLKFVEKCIACGIRDFVIADGDKRKQGQHICVCGGGEYKIMSFEQAISCKPELIIVSTGIDLFESIKHDLISKTNISIAWVDECIILDAKESYNMGNIKLKEPLKKSIICNDEIFKSIIDNNNINDLETYVLNGKPKKIVNKFLHYFEAYDRFFSKYRNRDIVILEIGVSKGGSLDLWKNYFSNGTNKVVIYGIDIDQNCKKYNDPDNDIHIMIGAQEDRNFLRQVKEVIGKADIVIDDGGHTMAQQIISLEELFDLVDDDGVYLCEDTETSYIEERGGLYRGGTFIEYSKSIIDVVNGFGDNEHMKNKFAYEVKSLSYYEGLFFIEKKRHTTQGAINVHFGTLK